MMKYLELDCRYFNYLTSTGEQLSSDRCKGDNYNYKCGRYIEIDNNTKLIY